MKIGMVTDSLGHLSLDDMLDTAARLGIKGVEFNAATGHRPHILICKRCSAVLLNGVIC